METQNKAQTAQRTDPIWNAVNPNREREQMQRQFDVLSMNEINWQEATVEKQQYVSNVRTNVNQRN